MKRADKLSKMKMPGMMAEEEAMMDLGEEMPEEEMMAEEEEMPEDEMMAEEEGELDMYSDEELMAEMEKRGLMPGGEIEEEEEDEEMMAEEEV